MPIDESSPARDQVILSNGVLMPRIGLGVFRSARGIETQQAVADALDLGYRHIDTATIYGNEADVGVALAASGLPRELTFVTTKVWNQDQGYDSTLRAFDASLRALGLSTIDLYLLHWPVPRLRLESWRALEALYEQGRVRAIGVSNFMVRHLDELAAHARVLPMVNQIEVHPFLQQLGVREWCARHRVAVAAYSPLAKASAFHNSVVTAVAREERMSAAQVLLTWGLARCDAVLPKSVQRQRQAENLAARSVTLSKQSLERLDALEAGRVTGWDPRKII